MSTNTFDAALDFMPDAKARRGGSFGSYLRDLIDAVRAGQLAEAEYRRLTARGVEPAKAAAAAFDATVATR